MKLSHSLSISAALGALLTHAAPVLEPRLLPSQPVAAGFSDPNSDPFYVAPSNISAYKAGQVVRQRSTVSTFKDNTNLDHSYQAMMRSENTQNQAIGGVATILVPKKVAAGAPKILSYQNFEDAVSLSCSPSWAYVDSSNSTAKLAANIEAPFYVNWALTQGYYVVIPDQEGEFERAPRLVSRADIPSSRPLSRPDQLVHRRPHRGQDCPRRYPRHRQQREALQQPSRLVRLLWRRSRHRLGH